MKRLLAGLILCLSLPGLPRVEAQAAPPWPTDGWLTATPESQGMESALLAAAYETVQDNDLNLHSLLVIRHGYLVAEMYRYPYTAETLHDQRSCTKSNTATLVGIANAEGVISGVDAPLLSFFPDQTIAHVDQRKQAVTLEHLLTMTSGLEWDEATAIPRLVVNPDWAAWMLDRPVVDEPGARFNYSSGGSNLLAAVVEQATGQLMTEYAAAKLYRPLGITHFRWDREPAGRTLGGFGLHMTPRDMAKLGYLYLHQGEWDGAQIVPADWVAAATSPQAPTNPEDGYNYGYQWWLPPDDAPVPYFAAKGYGGQLIFVHPALDLVVVFTAGTTDFDAYVQSLVFDHILPAAASDSPLPDNAEALAQLQAAINTLQNSPAQPVPELPDMAATISGKPYRFAFAPFYSGWRQFTWNSMTLTFSEGSAEAVLSLDDQALELPIGLDGLPRLTEIPGFGVAVLHGVWTAPDAFNIDLQVLGLPEHWSMRTRFVDDEMLMTFSEALSGESRSLVGKGGS